MTKKKSIKSATREQILRALEKAKKPKHQKKTARRIAAMNSPKRFKINSKADAIRAAKALDVFLKNAR